MVPQRQRQPPTCLSLFSNICLVLEPRLGLNTKQEDFCAAGCAGDKETFGLSLEYFIRAAKFRWPSLKLLCSTNFSSLSCGPLETWRGPLRYITQTGFLLHAGTTAQRGSGPPHSWGFWITHNVTTQSVGFLWTRDRPVAETCTWQTHNTYKRQTSIHLEGFEPAIPANDRSQTLVLDRAACGMGIWLKLIEIGL
jgi:hypothetical protein